ncbi:hypothetical protein J1P26_24705 [Neobacillus sp. MM2021_6]|uniref:hypothetical protein n=1 Tax=Bacillaceae TaxID=186817 RepID=UPI0014092B15|nr:MULTISPECIES: hypothetical protein [Bacillaceae]MBO0962877.1 hypothetical protein [Neobacillus sp. MM2021_6]NHC19603.1 hypothetical protein [Bacillus sp. MM2020_4]
MKRKVLSTVILLTVGFGIGTVTTTSANAETNYVIASVEWVLSKISPLEQKVNQLEQRVSSLENGEAPTAPPVQYSSVFVNKVTAVKKGASSTYDTFFNAPQGTILSYDSTYQNSVTGEKWYIVKLSDNRLGAIKSTDTSLQSQNPSSFSKVVFTKNAIIKRGAAASYETIYTASTGESLVYSSTYVNSTTGEKWYIVKTPNGKFGAVLSSFAEVIK